MNEPVTARDALSRLLRAGLLTAVVDGLFSSALTVLAYHTPVSKLWQRVASTLLGPSALDGGMRTVLIGLMMHVCVAFAWSAVFLLLYMRSHVLRRELTSTTGVIKVAAVYGPVIWIVMSCLVIPLLTGRGPQLAVRWWVQFFGHIPFVAIPIVASIAREVRAKVVTSDYAAA
jgi:hypothetical protein